MSDWAVLDRADPAPGDVEGTRALGRRLLDQAGRVEHETARLRSLAGNAGELKMAGDYAAEYTSALTELPDDLAKLAVAYRGCGTALTRYADDLAGAQTKAGRALADGSAADVRYRAALRDLRLLLPPGQQALASSSLNLTPSAVETATVTLDEGTREQIRHAASRARTADADLDQARTLADQAAALRGDGEERAARGIGDALEDSGIKNKSWLQKAWDTVSRPFRSWDDFVSLCGKVALIAGTAALFISGPIGWALMAAALVASAAIFANDLMRYSKGEVGLGTLAFDALGLIPGGRGVVSLSRWGKGLGTLGRALTRPGGFRTLASAAGKGLRNVTSAFPHALDVSKGIRGALKDPRLLGRALKCRFLGRDPIDMVTGEMVMQMTDFELPGLLPIVLERTYSSAYGVGRWFGPSWSSFLDQRLEVDGQGICFAYTEAVLLSYPPLAPGESSLPGEGPRLRLTRRADGHYSVTEPGTGRTFWFAAPPGELGVVLPLAAVSDRNGNRMDLGYDPVTGWLTEIDHTGGYRVEVDCQEGRITEFRLAGRDGEADTTIIRYGYDEPGRLTEIINSSGLPLRFGYDRHDRITSWTDRNGTWYRYTYDDAGRVIRTAGSAHCLDGEMRYDSANRVTVEVNSLGAETAYHYNEAGQVERVVDPLGRATTHSWDRYHRKTEERDPLGRTTRFVYGQDSADPTEVLRPGGSRVQMICNDDFQPVRVIQPDGRLWQYDYDDRGNLLTVTDPGGATTRFGYNALGAPLWRLDPMGRRVRLQTDAAGQISLVSDELGHVTRFRRDAFGRVTEVSDPLGNVTSFQWTVEGGLAAELRPTGEVQSWRYDGEGNLIEHVDAAGHVTTVEQTYFDLPSVRTDASGARVSFAYDSELRLTAVTDARGLTWRYEYDQAGRPTREVDYDGRVLRYTYDAAGQLVERVNGADEALRLAWDELGQLVRRESTSSTAIFEYDRLGRVARAVNPDAEVRFDRDPMGRILAETVNGLSTEFRYDRAGQRIFRRTPSGVESHWSHDPAGQPSALTAGGRTLNFAYDAAGREVERRTDERPILSQSWDARSRLVAQTFRARSPQSFEEVRRFAETQSYGAAARFGNRLPSGDPEPTDRHRRYTYRADDCIAGYTDSVQGERTYGLDALGRVTEVAGGGGQERYRYGPAGDVVSCDRPVGPVASGARTADSRGERVLNGSRISRAGDIHYSFDAQGRVVSRREVMGPAEERVWSYEWDAEDTLRTVRTPEGTVWSYQYDAFGRRIGKSGWRPGAPADEFRTQFTWDRSLLTEEVSFAAGAGGSRTWEWDQPAVTPILQITRRAEPGGRVGQEVHERCDFIVSDPNGTPRALVPDDPREVTVDLDAARDLWHADASGAAIPLQFPGQYRDAETGLHYNYFRYYDPLTAHFLSVDPLGLDGSLNPAHYVVNPTCWSDPMGLAPYTIKGRVKAAGLPTRGPIRYLPPENYYPSSPLPRGPQNGYIDRLRNEWVKGPSRTAGEPYEWDVQLSSKGLASLRRWTRDQKHVNVSLKGWVTHID